VSQKNADAEKSTYCRDDLGLNFAPWFEVPASGGLKRWAAQLDQEWPRSAPSFDWKQTIGLFRGGFAEPEKRLRGDGLSVPLQSHNKAASRWRAGARFLIERDEATG
jgi:hypothetical protein